MSQRSSSSGRKSRNDDTGCSQFSQKSGKGKLSQFPPGQLKRLTSDVVSYVLTLSSKKLVIKREAIVKNILKDMSKAYPNVILAVQKKLNKVFGLVLMELPNQKNQYIIVNKYSSDGIASHILTTNYEKLVYGLLLIVLCIIFMNGNVISENELWQSLIKLGIHDDVNHEIFGNVRQLICKEFVKQSYILYKPIPNTHPVLHEILWGPKADAEISKMEVLEFACQIYGNIKPDQFAEQFKEAEAE